MRFPFGLSPKPVNTGPLYGDLYARSVAAAIDVLMLFLVLNSLFERITNKLRAEIITGSFDTSKPMTLGQFFHILAEAHFLKFWLVNVTIQTIIIGICVVSFQILLGTTPGKWIMGLKIVRAETLEPVKPWQFMLRFLAYFVSIIPFMIGIFCISFNRQRRGWHDKIAGTVVLNVRPYGWYSAKIKQGFRYVFSKKAKDQSSPVE